MLKMSTSFQQELINDLEAGFDVTWTWNGCEGWYTHSVLKTPVLPEIEPLWLHYGQPEGVASSYDLTEVQNAATLVAGTKWAGWTNLVLPPPCDE